MSFYKKRNMIFFPFPPEGVFNKLLIIHMTDINSRKFMLQENAEKSFFPSPQYPRFHTTLVFF